MQNLIVINIKNRIVKDFTDSNMSCQESTSPSDHYKIQWNIAANQAGYLQIKSTTFTEISTPEHNSEYNSEFIQYDYSSYSKIIYHN